MAENPPKRPPFHRRNPKTALFLAACIAIFLLLAVLEIGLRLYGYRPAYLFMHSGQFMRHDSLIPSNQFFTDSTAIFRAVPAYFNDQEGYSVNRHGFRTPDFDSIDHTREKILLIGDSFTWGATAKPIDSAFADHITYSGYQTINMGIPGVDPDQYAMVAERYIPLFKPSAVCAFFYVANDIVHQRRILEPNKNRWHVTEDMGWIDPYLDHRRYMGDMYETYNYYEKRFQIPTGYWLNDLCRLSVIGTLAWQWKANKIGTAKRWDDSVRDSVEAYLQVHNADSGQITASYLQSIHDQCRADSIPFLIFFIPQHTELTADPFIRYPYLKSDLPWVMPEGLLRSHYNEWPDGHFNNAGHAFFGDFVVNKLKDSGIVPHKRISHE